jgi:MarR family transcriptional regulator, transcriptional regulator for hemolysin
MLSNPTDPLSPLGYWMSVATQQYYTAILQRLQHLDLDRWFIALVLIDEAGGSMSQQDLADALRQDKVTMVRAIDHLSAKGFVERRACPGDRRKYQLYTLPPAKKAVKEIRKVYDQVNDMAFGGMSAKDRKIFLGQLGTVIRNFSHLEEKKVNIRYSKKLPR